MSRTNSQVEPSPLTDDHRNRDDLSHKANGPREYYQHKSRNLASREAKTDATAESQRRLSGAERSQIFEQLRPQLVRRTARALGPNGCAAIVVARAIGSLSAEADAIGVFTPRELIRRLRWWLREAVVAAKVLHRAIDAYRRELATHAARLVGRQEACDLVQEALLRALSRREWLSFGDLRAALGYLRAVLTNLAREEWRRRGRLQLASSELEHDALVGELPGSDPTPEQWHHVAELERAFGQTSLQDRLLIVEYHAARQTGAPATEQERQHVFHSRKRVTRHLHQLGVLDVLPGNDNSAKVNGRRSR